MAHATNSDLVVNNPRKAQPNLFVDLMDAKPKPSRKPKLDIELKAYRDSSYTANEVDVAKEKLLKRHGPLLFYKENEIDFPIVSEFA